jgi:hypothetical protein
MFPGNSYFFHRMSKITKFTKDHKIWEFFTSPCDIKRAKAEVCFQSAIGLQTCKAQMSGDNGLKAQTTPSV